MMMSMRRPMADVVDMQGAPLAAISDFDALMMEIKVASGIVADLAFSARICSQAGRSVDLARAAVQRYDDELGPRIALLRARLAQPNPLANHKKEP